MAAREHGTKAIVKLGGQRLPSPAEPHLMAVTVEDDLTAPGSCLLTFADPERTILDQIGVELLQQVEVLASAVEEVDDQPLFTGEVYGFDFAEDETGTFALIRAYDAAYRLRQRRAVTSFNDVTDGDVVRRLAAEAEVATGQIDDGEVTHPYLTQVNQTHWDFLQERAAATGRVLRIREGKLDFVHLPTASDAPEPGDHASTDPLQLTAGHNLVYLRVRTSAAQQAGEVEVRGWDPATKQAVVAAETTSTRGVQLGTTVEEIAAAHGAAKRVAPFPELTTQAACDAIASSVAERRGAAFAYVEAQALGDPRLRAGTAVSMGRTGRFDGRYTLSATRHVLDDRGYHTSFTISGGMDRSVHGMATRGSGTGRQSFDGVYPAVVTNVDDPDDLGRARLTLPWLGDGYETDWARVSQIGAGDGRGVLWFPEVGDEVVVAFVAGDPAHPVVLGGLYNGADAPPFPDFTGANGQVDVRAIRTRTGHSLVFRDTAGEESIRVETGDGSVSITLDQAARQIHISSSGDVTVSGSGDVRVTAARDLTLEASGSATVKAGRSLRLESRGEVSVSGTTIKLN